MKYEIRLETASKAGQTNLGEGADKARVRIVLEGEIDLLAATELRGALRKAAETKPLLIVADLGGVPFIDSSGIATIVEALKNARRWSGTLKVENCQEAVRDTFEIAGLTEILGIV